MIQIVTTLLAAFLAVSPKILIPALSGNNLRTGNLRFAGEIVIQYCM